MTDEWRLKLINLSHDWDALREVADKTMPIEPKILMRETTISIRALAIYRDIIKWLKE